MLKWHIFHCNYPSDVRYCFVSKAEAKHQPYGNKFGKEMSTMAQNLL